MDHLARQSPCWYDPARLTGANPVPCSTSRETARRSGGAARTGALRPGLILIGDRGFAGREFEALVTAGCGLRPVRPGRKDEAPRHGSLGRIRHWIESANDTLKGQPGIERHGGRTSEGVYARVTQRLLAMARCIWHNWAAGEPVKRSLTAFDNWTHKESLI